MSRRPLVDALTDAIVRQSREWPSDFSAVHVAGIAAPLVIEGDQRLAEVARILAQHLLRNIEEAKIGRGRVTNRHLDQRLRRKAQP